MVYRRELYFYIPPCMLLVHVTGREITWQDKTVLGVTPDLMIRYLYLLQANESSDRAGASPGASDGAGFDWITWYMVQLDHVVISGLDHVNFFVLDILFLLRAMQTVPYLLCIAPNLNIEVYTLRVLW